MSNYTILYVAQAYKLNSFMLCSRINWIGGDQLEILEEIKVISKVCKGKLEKRKILAVGSIKGASN